MTRSQKEKGKEKERKKKTERNRNHYWGGWKAGFGLLLEDFKLTILNMFKELKENTKN